MLSYQCSHSTISSRDTASIRRSLGSPFSWVARVMCCHELQLRGEEKITKTKGRSTWSSNGRGGVRQPRLLGEGASSSFLRLACPLLQGSCRAQLLSSCIVHIRSGESDWGRPQSTSAS